MEEILTVEEVATLVRYSESHTRRLLKQGKIEYSQPSGKGGKIKIPLSAVNSFLNIQNSEEKNSGLIKDKNLPGPKPGWKKKNKGDNHA